MGMEVAIVANTICSVFSVFIITSQHKNNAVIFTNLHAPHGVTYFNSG